MTAVINKAKAISAGKIITITGDSSVGTTNVAVPSSGWTITTGQWYYDGVAISGATGLTYGPRLVADIGKRLTFAPVGLPYSADAGTTVTPAGDANRYMVATNRFALPVDWGTNDFNFAVTTEAGNPGGGNGTSFYAYTKRRVRFVTTWAPRAGKFLWTNAATITTGVRDSQFPITVQRAEIRLASDASLVDTVRWGGATSKVLAAGEKILSDVQVDLLPNTEYFLDLYTTAPAHAAFPTARPLYLAGEVTGESLGTNLSLGSMGSGTAGSAIGGYFEPAAFFARGWDGSPVAMVNGDSIADGTRVVANRTTARGDLGHVYEACGSATNGRWNYWPLARAKTSFQSTFSDNLGGFSEKGIINYVAECIALLGQVEAPFTFAWSESGRNSLGGGSTLADIKTSFNTYADLLLAKTGITKIVQQTTTPSSTPAANSFGYTEASQATSGANSDPGSNGILRQWNNWVISGCGGRALGIDTASVCRGTAYDKWAVNPFTATLINAVTANSTNIVTLSAQPPLGTTLVFEVGDATNADGANSASAYGVASVTQNGANWDCVLNSKRWGYQNPPSAALATRVAKAHAAGVSVVASNSTDGLHPEDNKQQEMRDYNIGRKADIVTYLIA